MSVICLLCSTEYEEEEKFCPSCGAANPMHADDDARGDETEVEGEMVPPGRQVNPLEEYFDPDAKIEQGSLVTVYRAPDEAMANIIKGILESESIPVTVASRQIPWMDGIMTMGEGFYGDLLVPESESERARLIIDAYRPESMQSDESS